MDWICGFSCDPSLTVTEQATTCRDTPQARPKAVQTRTSISVLLFAAKYLISVLSTNYKSCVFFQIFHEGEASL